MKKILFFTYDFPYPATSGGKVRAFNLLKYSGQDLEFHLFSFTRGDIQNQDIEVLKKLGIKSITLYQRRSIADPRNILSFISKQHSIFRYLYFEEKIAKDLVQFVKDEKIDVILLESFYTSFYIDMLKKTDAKIIFGTENIEHLVYGEYVEHNVSPGLLGLYKQQVKKIKEEELNAFKKSDGIITVTEEEKKEVGQYSNRKCYVLENGVDIENFQFKTKQITNNNILFIGNFTYFPNIDAAKFIKKNLILKLPDINFTIIGKKSTQIFKGVPYVIAKEYVENIQHEYENADIFIFPVKFGGGTNFKLLEAMASGVVVVGFSEKIKKLNAVDGIHFIAAENREEFINKTTNLFQNMDLKNKIIKNARELIEKNYEWKKIGKKLNSILKNI